jgi:hypothetical protein
MVSAVVGAHGVAVTAYHFALGYFLIYVVDCVSGFYHVGYFGDLVVAV